MKQLESAQKKHAETEDNLQQALEEKKALYTRFRDAQVELKILRKEMVRLMKLSDVSSATDCLQRIVTPSFPFSLMVIV